MKFLDRFRKVEAKHNVQSIQPTAPVIQPKAQDRLYELIEREQLPGDVRDTLAGALTGDLPRQQLLFQAMIDTWPRLQKNLNEVSRAVASTPWEVKPYSMTGDEPTDSAIDKARMVENSIRGMMPRAAHDELGERGLTKSLVHGYYMGHQVCEVFWDRNEDGTVPRSAKVVPPRYYDYPDDGEDRLMYLPHGGYYSSGFEEFPEHHFVIALNRGHSGHASIAAPLRALTGYWLAATFGLKWLLQFAQLYGIPFRWATYDDESVRTKVCNMLENIGSAGWGAFPSGTDLQFVEAGKSAEALPQAMLLEMADRQCDTFILGQTLTTDVGDSGSRALGDVHQEVRAGVIQGVNDFVADIYTHQLIPSIIQLNYGNKDELPEYCATVEAPKDEIAMAQRDQTLISMGMAVSKEWLYDRHGVPMPEDGDDDIFSPQPRNGAAGEPQTGEFSAPHETDGGEGDSEEEVEDEEVEAGLFTGFEAGTIKAGGWITTDEGNKVFLDNPRKESLEQGIVDKRKNKIDSEQEKWDTEKTFLDKKTELEDLANNSQSAEEFYKAVRRVKDIPAEMSEAFRSKYGKDNATPKEAAKRFFDEIKKRKAEARMVKAYDPDQPRGEKGTPEGGRWVKEDTAPQEGAVSQADSKRYSELEQKFNDGTITDEELGEAHDLVEKAAMAAGYDTKAYHGTDADFEVFDKSESGKRGSTFGDGFYFTSNSEDAQKHGSNVVNSYLKTQKVFNMDDASTEGSLEYNLADTNDEKEFVENITKAGYDSVYVPGGDGTADEIVVFNPNQIKSAEIFTGTPLEERFNPEDDRITFSHGVQAYDPNQKRGAKGTPDGGRWVKEDSKPTEKKKDAFASGTIDKIEKSHLGGYEGQDDFELVAYKGDDVMGYLSYSVFDDEVSISMVETRSTHKRKGIATELYKKLIDLHGEQAIKSSFATEEGAALR